MVDPAAIAHDLLVFILKPTIPLLVVYFVWDRIGQPSLRFRGVGWEDWSGDRRYYLRVKNRGRKAARKCEVDLFMVVEKNDGELIRFHEPLGWLSAVENTGWTTTPEDLEKRKTIPGKGVEKIDFGRATTEIPEYRYPPTMGVVSNNSGRPEGWKLSISNESESHGKTILERFYDKEKFLPTDTPGMGTELEKGQIGDFRPGDSIVEAEVRVTSEDTSLIGENVNMFRRGSKHSFFPKFYLQNLGGYFRAYVLWNRTLQKYWPRSRLRGIEIFR